jgi:hypothetical protein
MERGEDAVHAVIRHSKTSAMAHLIRASAIFILRRAVPGESLYLSQQPCYRHERNHRCMEER